MLQRCWQMMRGEFERLAYWVRCVCHDLMDVFVLDWSFVWECCTNIPIKPHNTSNSYFSCWFGVHGNQMAGGLSTRTISRNIFRFSIQLSEELCGLKAFSALQKLYGHCGIHLYVPSQMPLRSPQSTKLEAIRHLASVAWSSLHHLNAKTAGKQANDCCYFNDIVATLIIKAWSWRNAYRPIKETWFKRYFRESKTEIEFIGLSLKSWCEMDD